MGGETSSDSPSRVGLEIILMKRSRSASVRAHSGSVRGVPDEHCFGRGRHYAHQEYAARTRRQDSQGITRRCSRRQCGCSFRTTRRRRGRAGVPRETTPNQLLWLL